ncbi:hypothetical protein [Ekhidna sp.]|uniref:hypothetical protein n=1 Tax=Ekhidna sp. TaxID=2608089 RepID=UPI003297618D
MRSFIFVFLIALTFIESGAQLRYEDQIRIKEAKQISYLFGDLIWSGYNEPPFAILFVMDNYEYLIEHYYQPDDFARLEYDTIIHSTLHRRPAQMNKNFLATFPFAGLNTIVIGTPENTGLNSTEWIVTLLHERFHQYQYSSPKYFLETNELNLAKGDESGMWQLNYPFPYKDAKVIMAYETYTQALYEAVKSIGKENWEATKKEFFSARRAFKSALVPDDYKYISFQWYQEGIARYTEYAFLEKLENYEASEEVKKLPDFVPFDEYKESFFQKHIENVRKLKLEEVGRVTVYDVGFAEALLLRELNPNWDESYLKVKFDLEKLY